MRAGPRLAAAAASLLCLAPPGPARARGCRETGTIQLLGYAHCKGFARGLSDALPALAAAPYVTLRFLSLAARPLDVNVTLDHKSTELGRLRGGDAGLGRVVLGGGGLELTAPRLGPLRGGFFLDMAGAGEGDLTLASARYHHVTLIQLTASLYVGLGAFLGPLLTHLDAVVGLEDLSMTGAAPVVFASDASALSSGPGARPRFFPTTGGGSGHGGPPSDGVDADGKRVTLGPRLSAEAFVSRFVSVGGSCFLDLVRRDSAAAAVFLRVSLSPYDGVHR